MSYLSDDALRTDNAALPRNSSQRKDQVCTGEGRNFSVSETLANQSSIQHRMYLISKYDCMPITYFICGCVKFL